MTVRPIDIKSRMRMSFNYSTLQPEEQYTLIKVCTKILFLCPLKCMVTFLNLLQGCSDLILQQMLFFWHLLHCESRWLSHSSTSDLPFSFLSLSLTSIPQKESVRFLKTSSIFLCVIAILLSLARTLIRVCVLQFSSTYLTLWPHVEGSVTAKREGDKGEAKAGWVACRRIYIVGENEQCDI